MSKLFMCSRVQLVPCARLLATQAQATDPVQQLFVDKVRAYQKKSDAAGGKMVDVNAQVQADMEKQLKTVAAQFQFDSVENALKFPELKFEPVQLDDVKIESDAKSKW